MRQRRARSIWLRKVSDISALQASERSGEPKMEEMAAEEHPGRRQKNRQKRSSVFEAPHTIRGFQVTPEHRPTLCPEVFLERRDRRARLLQQIACIEPVPGFVALHQ